MKCFGSFSVFFLYVKLTAVPNWKLVKRTVLRVLKKRPTVSTEKCNLVVVKKIK